MKTLTHGFAKRILSLALALMMIVSLCVVGITSASSAEVEVETVGASRTFAAGDYIYVKNFTPSGWSANWFHSDVTEWMHLWNSSTNVAIDVKFELIEGTENAVGAIYGAKVTTAGTYTHVIFTRSHSTTDPWVEQNQTGDIPLDATNNCYTNLVVGGTTYTGSVYNGGGSSTTTGEFWVDLDGDLTTTLDQIFPDKEGSTYRLYLPSHVTVDSANKATLTFFVSEDSSLTIGGANIAATGSTYLFNTSGTYNLGGDFSGSLKLYKSSNVSTIYTTTNIDVPQGTYQGYEHKDDFETKGSIMVISPDGTQKNSDTVLKKIKGRGNSSWEASHKIIGKYAFNITLDKKAKLLDDSSKSKKYCLVSYNADEARMRNMLVYDLAAEIGVDFTAKFEPIDLYNNGKYIGSYLLTDKVEIGDPLVDIVNLDEINELLGTVDEDLGPFGDNFALYDDDSLMTRAYGGGSSINDTSTKGFYKYISNLEEPDPSEYADSGFLLEFELNERFDDEISGFISNEGQQIVCKYPEFATRNEIQFIMNKWNTAEALMYDETATYEELSEVIDVESFARMYLIQELTKNLDGGATSFYVFYHEGRLQAGCAWDYDWTLGQYEKTYTDRVNSGSDFYGNVDANPSNYGGWYLNSKNIYAASTLNAQAALCQNDAFWSVVTAEWDEIFYNTAMTYTAPSSSVSSAATLGGKIAEYYNLVKASTAMDETKWGLIASDPFIVNNWGSTDTGDTHEAATVWLSDWVYDRLTWMDKYISTDGSSHGTAPYNVNYVIQPPVVSADADSYQIGDTVTLTIENVTGGNYTYTIYKDGAQVATTTDSTYTFTADEKGISDYTVKATSNTSAKISDFSDAAAVNVEGVSLKLDVTAPEQVMVGDSIVIEASANVDETVTYTLFTSGDTQVAQNTTGEFTIATTKADADTTKSYYILASATVDGETLTAQYDIFDVEVTAFEFSVSLTAPESVEAGMIISLKATSTSNQAVTYTFYNAADDSVLATNTTGVYTIDALDSDIGTTKSFYVVATTTVAGDSYTATSETKSVSVTTVKETYEVTVYFKSTGTLGYKPLLTTTGTLEDMTDYAMIRDAYICKNATQTAAYYWYKADVTVSKASPSMSIQIKSSRYAMDATYNFTVSASGSYYFGIDNLNAGAEMINMTDWTEDERNWTQSALHMVYDAEIDAEKLAEVSARVNLRYIGDANDDGIVNIKDATLIQKYIAGITAFDDLGMDISDVDGDGRVTIKDATAVQKKLVALL
ncbi:MAG: CotH kinase family protein [Clostridia bacterium]|nr:CotH kinase family protein [Clostridia bacterium]